MDTGGVQAGTGQGGQQIGEFFGQARAVIAINLKGRRADLGGSKESNKLFGTAMICVDSSSTCRITEGTSDLLHLKEMGH